MMKLKIRRCITNILLAVLLVEELAPYRAIEVRADDTAATPGFADFESTISTDTSGSDTVYYAQLTGYTGSTGGSVCIPASFTVSETKTVSETDNEGNETSTEVTVEITYNVTLGAFNPGSITDLSFANGVKAGSSFALVCDDSNKANSTLTAIDLTNLDLSSTTSLADAFKDYTALETVNFGEYTASNVTDMSNMFSGCSAVETLDLSKLSLKSGLSCTDMLSGMSSLKTLKTPASIPDGISISLPYAMYDSSNNEYKVLDSSCRDLTLSKNLTDTAWQDSFDYTLDESGPYIKITNYKGDAADAYAVPAGAIVNHKRYTTALEGSLTVNGIGKLSFESGVKVLPTVRTVGNITYQGLGPISGSSLTEADISNLDFTNLTSLAGIFEGNSQLAKVSIDNNNLSSLRSLNSMFKSCPALTSVDFSGSIFNNSNNIDIGSMFEGCTALSSVDLTPFKTAALSDMSGMFKNCTSLESFDLSGLNLSRVSNTADIFNGCSKLSNVVFPSSLKTIGSGAFSGCADGLYVTIPAAGSITAVTAAAFDSDKKVTLRTPHKSTAYNITNEPDATNRTENIYWLNSGSDFVVRFFNDDRTTELKKSMVNGGYSAVPPSSSALTSTVSANAIFDHWEWYNSQTGQTLSGSAAYQSVYENRNVYAVYRPLMRVIRFKNDGGADLGEVSVKDGDRFPENTGIDTEALVSQLQEFPEDYEFACWSYSIDGFDPATDAVSENMICTAVYKRKSKSGVTAIKYTVNFYDSEGQYLNSEIVPSGSYVKTLPAEPADFGGWYDHDTGLPWSCMQPVYKNTDVYARKDNKSNDDSALNPIPEYDSTIYMVRGQKMELAAGYKWSSVDSRVASVSKYTKLVARRAGKTLVHTTQGNVEIQFDLIVVEPKLSEKKITLSIGDTYTVSVDGLEYNGVPYTAEYPVILSCADQKIAQTNGMTIYALAKGSSKICATINGRQFKASLEVVSTQKNGKLADGSRIELAPLQNIPLKLMDFTSSGASWVSNDDLTEAYDQDKDGYPRKFQGWQNEVVRITPAGRLIAVGSGSCTLKGTDKKGRRVTLYITVREPVENVIYINAGSKKDLSYYGVRTASAAWKISDVNSRPDSSAAAALVAKGRISALRSGQARVSCTYDPYGSRNGGFTFTTLVCVEEPYLSVDNTTLWRNREKDHFNYTMLMNKTESYCLLMNNCYQKLTYTSSSPTVAWVDEYGYVHAEKAGKTTIKTKINGKTFTIRLTVH